MYYFLLLLTVASIVISSPMNTVITYSKRADLDEGERVKALDYCHHPDDMALCYEGTRADDLPKKPVPNCKQSMFFYLFFYIFLDDFFKIFSTNT